jgi:outer membrane protein
MNSRTFLHRAAGALLLTVAAGPAFAYETGTWLVRGGVHYIDPKSDNHDVVEVEGAAMASFNVTYMFAPNFGVEVLGSLPFEHDIELVDGGDTVGSVKHLPPTVSVVYHFLPDAPVKPYIGVGINYTLFFDEETSGALRNADLSLDPSLGAAFVFGVDVPLRDNWFVNADVRYIDIETDADVDLNDGEGGKLELEGIDIDPWVFGLTVGYQF